MMFNVESVVRWRIGVREEYPALALLFGDSWVHEFPAGPSDLFLVKRVLHKYCLRIDSRVTPMLLTSMTQGEYSIPRCH
jgi:hypothetical protein